MTSLHPDTERLARACFRDEFADIRYNVQAFITRGWGRGRGGVQGGGGIPFYSGDFLECELWRCVESGRWTQEHLPLETAEEASF